MTLNFVVEDQLGYATCPYGQSRPHKCDLEGDYLAFVGSSETFGRPSGSPLPELVGEVLGMPTVDLGHVNAGVDTFLNDPTLRDICAGAAATIVQIMGAERLSNAYYSVHCRRNDRFLDAHAPLRRLFPEVDFTGVNFARHLLWTLSEVSNARMDEVRRTLCDTWLHRMKTLIKLSGGPVSLLWVSEYQSGKLNQDLRGREPLFIDRHMIGALSGPDVRLVEILDDQVPPGPKAQFRAADELRRTLS